MFNPEVAKAEIHIHDDTCIKGFFNTKLSNDRWLSNMHECTIIWMNMEFMSVEAAYQASKATTLKIAKEFIPMTGKQAKAHSHKIEHRPDWNNIKLSVMAQLVHQKFFNHPKLQEKLVDTWPLYLEETNYWNDIYWGVCKGKGQNNLGRLLMATRAYFKEYKEQ
jgi:ribA/ribD-fused uncharacterized protein